MNAKQTFLLGTAVKISTFLNVENPTSAKIKIVDAGNVLQVDNADMTQDSPDIYSYIYQSESTDTEGECVVTISITSGGYTTVAQDTFTLLEQA